MHCLYFTVIFTYNLGDIALFSVKNQVYFCHTLSNTCLCMFKGK